MEVAMTMINVELHNHYTEYYKQEKDGGREPLDYPHWLEQLSDAIFNQEQEIRHPRKHRTEKLETHLFAG